MNHNLTVSDNNNIYDLFLDSKRFEIPIISKEDTCTFSINFINQKDMAIMPIYLDDNLPFENSENENVKDNNQNFSINNISIVFNLNNI